jgi:hypothetical protein
MDVIAGLRFSAHPPKDFTAEDVKACLHDACDGCDAELRSGIDIAWPSPDEPAVISVNRLHTHDLADLEGIHDRMVDLLKARGVEIVDSGVFHPEPLELAHAKTPGVLYDEAAGVVTIEPDAVILELHPVGKDRLLMVSEKDGERLEEFLPHVVDVVDLRHGSLAP